MKDQAAPGSVIWLTGLSGSGKTTLGLKLVEHLRSKGVRADFIDGDLTREFFQDTDGYTKENRLNNIKRIVFAAMLLSRNGLTVVVANIAPYAEARRFARKKLPRYVEVYLRASVEECERRDPKGHYAKARRGEVKNFIGIHDAYETPEDPDLVLETGVETAEASLAKVLRFLKA